jgi:glycine dehydrogenase subunit 1
VLRALKARGILGGMPFAPYFPELGNSLLVCATETKTADDVTRFADNMTRIIGKRFQPAPCAIKPERHS